VGHQTQFNFFREYASQLLTIYIQHNATKEAYLLEVFAIEWEGFVPRKMLIHVSASCKVKSKNMVCWRK